jgi:hypothetical protein
MYFWKIINIIDKTIDIFNICAIISQESAIRPTSHPSVISETAPTHTTGS